MEDLKDDSILCLRLMIVISVLFMVIFSKIGAYIIGLIVIGFNCYILSELCNIPFLRNFMLTTILGSVAFQFSYPMVFTTSESYLAQSKEVFQNARMELKRRSLKK